MSRKLPLVLRNKLRSKEGKRLGLGCAAELRLGLGFGRDPVLLAWVVLLGCHPPPPQDHSQFGGSCDGGSEGSTVPAWVVTQGVC